MKIEPITVSELNRYMKNKVADDEFLNSVFVRGEISNFKNHYTGHMYFTLKDENSLIKCICFKSYASRLAFIIKDGMKIMPAVNQVEFNPFTQQKELRKVMAENNILLEAWYPLGHGNKELLENEVILNLANKYHKNAGQIILRWIYQEGVVSLPKSTNLERMQGNIDIFDFELTAQEMKAIEELDTGKPTHNPEDPINETRLMGLKIHD